MSETIESLLKEGREFPPSDDFRAPAIVNDAAIYDAAEQDYEAFWAGWAEKLTWFEKWHTVLEWEPPYAKWFLGGKMNACYNCVDRHADRAHGNRTAIISEGEPGDVRTLTFFELKSEVSRVASALKELGVEKGDIVCIYMPMTAELAIAMLACARIGAAHSVVFGGFSAEALRERINDAQAVAVVTADGGWRRGKIIELKKTVDEALEDCPSVKSVIVLERIGSDVARASSPSTAAVPASRGEFQTRKGWHLPHWTAEGAIYHVVFRLADSLPQSVLVQIQAEREELERKAEQSPEGLTVHEQRRIRELYSEKIEKYLDAGHGAAHFRNPAHAELVAGALEHFDGKRYQLHAWCVMPNHVHVVVEPFAGEELAKILHSWKSFTSHELGKTLGGGMLWQSEYYDRIIRDEEEYSAIVQYVLDNPRVAGLSDWKWVSARDERDTGRDGRATGGPTTVWWHDIVPRQSDDCPCEPMDSEDLLFTLYTSGSTGKPKGIVHTTGGYLTGTAATFKTIFDYHDDDIFWCTADCGWITGHSYVVYGPLANAATIVMYEGAPDTPDKDRFWRIVEKHKVTILYTAPTAIRAFMKWGDEYPARCDMSSLRLLGSVGEPINPEAWVWYWKNIGGERCPVVDTWWQTETGQILITPLPGITVCKPGSATRPFPGIKAEIFREDGSVLEGPGGGYLVLTRPWPAMLRGIFNDPERYVQQYWSRFPGVYFTGDGVKRDEDGYLWLLGRVDDVMNVAGHRISTMEVESALVDHPAVAEAAVIGRTHDLKGQAIAAFVLLRSGSEGQDLVAELRDHVAKVIGPIARPDDVFICGDLPKTRSGKIMRRLLRDVAEGRALGDTTTLADPGVVASLKDQYEHLEA